MIVMDVGGGDAQCLSARTPISFHTKKSLKSLYFLPIVMEMFLPASKIMISYSNIDGVTRTNDTKTIANVDLKRVNKEIKKLTW